MFIDINTSSYSVNLKSGINVATQLILFQNLNVEEKLHSRNKEFTEEVSIHTFDEHISLKRCF